MQRKWRFFGRFRHVDPAGKVVFQSLANQIRYLWDQPNFPPKQRIAGAVTTDYQPKFAGVEKSRDAQAHRRASCGTIRLKLLKIGELVRTSVRRIKLALRSAFPIKPSTMPLTPR
jgi:hypothetical protein